jgi:CHAT domain-containing protein
MVKECRFLSMAKQVVRSPIAWLLLLPLPLGSAALAQVSAGGLGTRVNGSTFGRCQVGSCSVHGGTPAGANLFHRLGQLDTRSGIKDVRIDTLGRGNVILGVSNPAGTFLNVPLTLSDSANLFLLSPGGLWLGQGSQFNRIPNLLLSTGIALELPDGRFDAIQSARSDLHLFGARPALRFDPVAIPNGQNLVIGARGGGSLVVDRALLSINGGLILDAPTSPLVLRQAHLRAGRALKLSGQGFSLLNSSLGVGDPGRRGPIDLRSNLDPFSGSFASGTIDRVRMSGNQINIRAGSLHLKDSRLSAPKGWVELQTTNPMGRSSDLWLINSHIDLNPALAADAWSPQILRRLNSDGSDQEIRNPVPHIGLFSRGSVQIERSSLDASLLLPNGEQPAPERILAALPERAGLILAEAAGNLSVNASTLRADASHALAGVVSMEAGKDAQGAASRGELRIRDSQLSASYGAGSGTILLQANDGLAVVKSNLMAITDRRPVVPGFPSGDSAQPTFFGGQITLYNQSDVKPLQVSSSAITATQTTEAGPLNSPFLGSSVDQDNFGSFGTRMAWKLGLDPTLTGGFLQLYSNGGLRVDADSRLDVSSLDPLSGQLDTMAGSIALLNSGPAAIEIKDSRLEGRNGMAPDSSGDSLKAGAVYLYGDGDIRLHNVLVDLSAVFSRESDHPLADALLEINAGGRLRIEGRSVLISRAKNAAAIYLHDKLVSFDLSDEQTNLVLSRMFSGGSRFFGDVYIDPEKRPVLSVLRAFRDFIEYNRINNESIYSGSVPGSLSLPQPLSSPPPGVLPPQVLARQPMNRVEAQAMANEAQPDAALQLLEGQQQSLADTVASLGLPPGSGRLRSVPELQARLLRIQQSTSGSPGAAKAASTPSLPLTPYRPAIIQWGLSELPGDQVQISSILLLANGPPLSFTQTLPAARVKRAIRGFQLQLSRQEAIDPATGPGQELARWLLQPLADPLRASGANALVLAVDRGLQAIPYGALPFGDQPLAQRYALSVTPSLGLLDLEEERGPADGVLLAAGASRFQQALEPLPMVPRELAALAGEQEATLLLDEAFTLDALESQARQERFRRLHIATHADFQPGKDEVAKLYTPRDSISLTALRRSLQSRSPKRPMDLISLSACHTALGDEQSELGFVGTALQAGARSAVGTLWEVDDSATAAFFIQFYRYLRSGLEKDRALQATARAFWNGSVRLEGDGLIGPRVTAGGDALLLHVESLEERRRLSAGLRHPHYWAGMVLTGSPW